MYHGENLVPRPAKKSTASTEAPHPNQQYALPSDAPWGGFVNIRLSDEQKDQYFSWLRENAANASALFTDMLGSGIKATFSYDLEHSCFIVAVTGALMGGSPNTRFVSTSRSSDLADAISLTVWKHFILASGDYGNYRPKDSSFMMWG